MTKIGQCHEQFDSMWVSVKILHVFFCLNLFEINEPHVGADFVASVIIWPTLLEDDGI